MLGGNRWIIPKWVRVFRKASILMWNYSAHLARVFLKVSSFPEFISLQCLRVADSTTFMHFLYWTFSRNNPYFHGAIFMFPTSIALLWRHEEGGGKPFTSSLIMCPETTARICKPFIESRNRFPAWRASTSPYLSYRPARLHRLVRSIPWNQFLGSLDVYKYGLCLDRGGGEQSNTSPTHHYSISKLIRGYIIQRRRDRYSSPQCFLYDYREASILTTPSPLFTNNYLNLPNF